LRIPFRYLALAGVAAAIASAPIAAADDTNQNCTTAGSATECSSPGNVQINASPSDDAFTLPYWDEVFGGAYPGPYPVPYAEGNR
jgi:hypothetical protein